MMLILGVFTTVGCSTSEPEVRITDEQGPSFAGYFEENHNISDDGERIEISAGGDGFSIEITLPSYYIHSSSEEKKYLADEFKREKDELFEDWRETENIEGNIAPSLVLLVDNEKDTDKYDFESSNKDESTYDDADSYANRTVIAEEVEGEISLKSK